jgi:SAM-dependent methyltransferase
LEKCRFCGGELSFVVATNSFVVQRCAFCDLFLTKSFVSRRAHNLQFYNRGWHIMARLSEKRVVKEKKAMIERIRAAGAPHDGELLEIGPGAGQALHVARRIGYRVTGIDVNPLNCRQIQERWGIRVICGPAEDYPFQPESFDVIVMSQVIEHMERPDVLIKKLSRLLKPGGCLHIDTPCPRNFLTFLFGWRVGSSFGLDHVTLFTPSSLRSLLGRFGLRRGAGRFYLSSLSLADMLLFGAWSVLTKRWIYDEETAKRELLDAWQSQPPPPRDTDARRAPHPPDECRESRLHCAAQIAFWILRRAFASLLSPWWPLARKSLSRRRGLPLFEMQALKPSST